MPWIVEKKTEKRSRKPSKIIRKDTGKTVGSSKPSAKAQASVRARYASLKKAVWRGKISYPAGNGVDTFQKAKK